LSRGFTCHNLSTSTPFLISPFADPLFYFVTRTYFLKHPCLNAAYFLLKPFEGAMSWVLSYRLPTPTAEQDSLTENSLPFDTLPLTRLPHYYIRRHSVMWGNLAVVRAVTGHKNISFSFTH
jgi:hypothetical protein